LDGTTLRKEVPWMRQRRSKKKKPPEPDGIGGFRSRCANRTGDKGIGDCPAGCVENGGLAENCHSPGHLAAGSTSAREAWSKQPAMGWANLASKNRRVGTAANPGDDSWDKLASRLDATPWYRWKSRCRLLPNQLRHRHPTKRPPAQHPLPNRNWNRQSSAEADHDHEHR